MPGMHSHGAALGPYLALDAGWACILGGGGVTSSGGLIICHAAVVLLGSADLAQSTTLAQTMIQQILWDGMHDVAGQRCWSTNNTINRVFGRVSTAWRLFQCGCTCASTLNSTCEDM